MHVAKKPKDEEQVKEKPFPTLFSLSKEKPVLWQLLIFHDISQILLGSLALETNKGPRYRSNLNAPWKGRIPARLYPCGILTSARDC